MRSASRPARLALAAAAALVFLPAAPAHAQFGRLVKRAAEAAAGAAAGAAGERVAEKAGIAAPSGGKADSPALVEITPERLDAVVIALRPLLDEARKREAAQAARRAHEADVERYRAARSTYDDCKDRVTDGLIPDMRNPALQQVVVRFTEGNVRLTDLQVKAQQAGNVPLARAYADSIGQLQQAVEETSFPILRKQCGAPPREPLRLAPEAEAPALLPAIPQGMTAYQFGLMRERIGAWLLAQGAGGALRPAETGALESRRAAIEALKPYFATIHWSNPMDGLRADS